MRRPSGSSATRPDGDHRPLDRPSWNPPSEPASWPGSTSSCGDPAALEPFETVRVRKDGVRIDVETTVSPIVDAAGELIAVSAISRDISERKRSETLSAGQARLLALVAEGTPLHRAARPGGPIRRGAVVGGARIDPAARPRTGSTCATERLRASPTTTARRSTVSRSARRSAPAARPRIAASRSSSPTSRHDPLWADFRELALGAGLRACWSTPIFATDGTLLGTFAMYYREPRGPDPHDLQLVETAMHVVGIALERSLAEQALRARARSATTTCSRTRTSRSRPSRSTTRSPR